MFESDTHRERQSLRLVWSSGEPVKSKARSIKPAKTDKTPAAPKARKSEPDQRGTIVAMLLKHFTDSTAKQWALGHLPLHDQTLTASDAEGVKAILADTSDDNDKLKLIKLFFERKTAK